jgi:hypothetical protein
LLAAWRTDRASFDMDLLEKAPSGRRQQRLFSVKSSSTAASMSLEVQ